MSVSEHPACVSSSVSAAWHKTVDAHLARGCLDSQTRDVGHTARCSCAHKDKLAQHLEAFALFSEYGRVLFSVNQKTSTLTDFDARPFSD